MTELSFRPAVSEDIDAIRELLPRLADFDIPAHREARHLWRGDEDLLIAWASGDKPECHAFVAVHENKMVGVSLITLRQELLSQEPSSHLEVLVAAKSAEGLGVGRGLIELCEAKARSLGALTMSLNVVASNAKARGLYNHLEFKEDIVRYIKTL